MPATEFCCLMNLTSRPSGSTKASSQMPRSPTVPQPRRSTLVDSTITRPAPPAANLPAFIRCQSVGNPFTAEYWCIGGTTIRLRNATSRIDSGVNSLNPDTTHSLARILRFVCEGRYRAAAARQSRKSDAAKAGAPASHAILGWPKGPGSDTRKANNSLQHFSGRTNMNEATPIRPARNVELGASTEPFQNLHEFVRKARANLNQNAWDYIVGAAETETTMRRNRMALDEIAFRPRVLNDVAKVYASVERFGRRMRLPVMLAPVGALEIFDPKGAAASVTRGAGRFGAAHMLSSVSE